MNKRLTRVTERRRQPPWLNRAKVIYFATLVVLFALVQLQWTTTAPEQEIVLGANFSCNRVVWLGQDCRTVLDAALDDLGLRDFRLSVNWNEVERAPGVFTWEEFDWQLDAIYARGGRAVVSIGMKAQRFPEFYLPDWVTAGITIPPNVHPEDYAPVAAALFPFLEAAARHIGAHPAVEAIQVENEPFVYFPSHANGWHIRPDFLEREIATVRAADPGRHPILVTYASHLRSDDTWQWILDNADLLGQSVYTKRQRSPWDWLYFFPYQIGPWTPDLPQQARAAGQRGKQLWLTELQAEPYEQHRTVDPRERPGYRLRSISPRLLRENVQLARRSGATRAYLWGIEWWYYVREQRGEPELWETGRALMDRGAVVAGNVR